MSKTLEGLWDCQTCKKVGIPGFTEFCPSCGQSRDGTEIYLPDNARVITDPDELARANAGPDWYCEHCGSSNVATKDYCIQCGAEKGGSPEHSVTIYDNSEVPSSYEEAMALSNREENIPSIELSESHYEVVTLTEKADRFTSSIQIVSEPTTSRRNILQLGGILAIIALLIGGGWFFFFSRENVDAHVTGFSWERSIPIEEYRTFHESDWSLPVGGRYVSQRQEIHHYNKVFSHNEPRTRTVTYYETETKSYSCTKDNKNGSFTSSTCTKSESVRKQRQEPYLEPIYDEVPEYRTKYTYDIDRWVHGRNAISGADDQTPYWAEFTLGSKERESASPRHETYIILLTDGEGEEYRETVTLEEWKTFSLGEAVTMSVNRVNDVDDLKKAA